MDQYSRPRGAAPAAGTTSHQRSASPAHQPGHYLDSGLNGPGRLAECSPAGGWDTTESASRADPTSPIRALAAAPSPTAVRAAPFVVGFLGQTLAPLRRAGEKKTEKARPG